MTETIKVDARTKSVREMLDHTKYDIDFYQREYRWEGKHIAELLEDLEAVFLDVYNEDDPRSQVRHYRHYFLGSVIISNKNGHNYIIDGQQRLTSLTLLLIYLHHLQRELQVPEDSRVDIQSMIFSTQYGKKSFNLDIEERQQCMEMLYNNEAYDPNGASESVRNLVARHDDIQELFPDTLKGHPLPYFIDWLTENVDLVQITAYSDDEAYAIFETMNDRGLRLSPTEMLKGYLLTNIKDDEKRSEANELWKQRILGLIQIGREEELDIFKAWLRAQYADSIRPRRRGASNQDFERIGTVYHKWVRENAPRMGLRNSTDFEDFVLRRFEGMSRFVCK